MALLSGQVADNSMLAKDIGVWKLKRNKLGHSGILASQNLSLASRIMLQPVMLCVSSHQTVAWFGQSWRKMEPVTSGLPKHSEGSACALLAIFICRPGLQSSC